MSAVASRRSSKIGGDRQQIDGGGAAREGLYMDEKNYSNFRLSVLQSNVVDENH